MNILEEYKQSLKYVEAEEPLDLYLYRIVSFVFVKIIYPLPITPNQLSMTALIMGIVSAFFFSSGTAETNKIAALFYAIYYLFDLSDGQVARLKKKGTRTGRIIDGISDYVTHFAIYIALGISYNTAGGWFLVLFTLICLMVHVILFDFYRNRYLEYAIGEVSLYGDNLDMFQKEYDEIKAQGGYYFNRFIYFLYLKYIAVQSLFISPRSKEQHKQKFERNDFLEKNRPVIRLWSFMGSSLHVTLLIFTAIYNRIDIYFYGIIIVINIYALFMMIIQKLTDKKTQLIKSGVQL